MKAQMVLRGVGDGGGGKLILVGLCFFQTTSHLLFFLWLFLYNTSPWRQNFGVSKKKHRI